MSSRVTPNNFQKLAASENAAVVLWTRAKHAPITLTCSDYVPSTLRFTYELLAKPLTMFYQFYEDNPF